MKKITITVDVDGNSVSRDYKYNEESIMRNGWDEKIEDMLDTLSKSNEPMGDMPGFEGTLQALNELEARGDIQAERESEDKEY